MDTTQAAADPTTSRLTADALERDSLLFALRYGQRYGQRLCRLYSRAALALRVGELVLGSSAFAAFLIGNPALAAQSGLALAIISAINISFDPAAKAKDASLSQEQFGRALVEADAMGTEQLRRLVLGLQAQPRPEIESLRMPVWRDVVAQLGRPVPNEPLRKMESLFAVLA